jgi:hypothetical protein
LESGRLDENQNGEKKGAAVMEPTLSRYEWIEKPGG